MSLSEIFDHGSPHTWANLRINNLNTDGILTQNISKKNYVNKITTSDIFSHTFLSIPIQNNAAYYVKLVAVAYTTVGNPSFGVVSQIEHVFSFLAGVLNFDIDISPPTNTLLGYSGAVDIGALITIVGSNILFNVINQNIAQITDWVINTEVIITN